MLQYDESVDLIFVLFSWKTNYEILSSTHTHTHNSEQTLKRFTTRNFHVGGVWNVHYAVILDFFGFMNRLATEKEREWEEGVKISRAYKRKPHIPGISLATVIIKLLPFSSLSLPLTMLLGLLLSFSWYVCYVWSVWSVCSLSRLMFWPAKL